jgi:hypothetical protein
LPRHHRETNGRHTAGGYPCRCECGAGGCAWHRCAGTWCPCIPKGILKRCLHEVAQRDAPKREEVWSLRRRLSPLLWGKIHHPKEGHGHIEARAVVKLRQTGLAAGIKKTPARPFGSAGNGTRLRPRGLARPYLGNNGVARVPRQAGRIAKLEQDVVAPAIPVG